MNGTVWLVWRVIHSDDVALLAVCATEEAAEGVALKDADWFATHYGPKHPTFARYHRHLKNALDERIEWEERPVDS
jgi:molybdopterin-guanine dinucleotide biosynthesis protein A